MAEDTEDSGGMDAVLLATIAAARAGGSRSPLKAWLTDHHDAIAGVIEAHGANWKRLSRVWVEKGLMPRPEDFDAPGKAGENARQRVAATAKKTWLRVRAERRHAGPVEAPPPLARVEPAPAPAVSGGTVDAEAEALAARKPTFGVARPRGMPSSGTDEGG